MPIYVQGMQTVQSTGMVESIRPLALGAACWDSFDFIAPKAWSSGVVLMQLFNFLPMADEGWTPERTELTFLGDDIMGRTWRAKRKRG